MFPRYSLHLSHPLLPPLCPQVSRQILSHWTTREVLIRYFQLFLLAWHNFLCISGRHVAGNLKLSRKEKSLGEISIIATFAAFLNTTVVLIFGTELIRNTIEKQEKETTKWGPGLGHRPVACLVVLWIVLTFSFNLSELIVSNCPPPRFTVSTHERVCVDVFWIL